MRVATLNRILGAALCAAAATYLTVSWLGTGSTAPPPVVQRTIVVEGGQPVPIEVAAPVALPEMKTVLVAKQHLPFGTTLTTDVVTGVPWPAESVPPGTFTNFEALLESGGPRTVVSAFAPNEPILASKITGPGQKGSLSAVIDEGKTAVTIRVDDVLGVAGFVQPDDRVDILLTRIERQSSSVGKAVIENAYTDVLLQNVRVLAVDQIADRSPKAQPAKAVTVEVATADAQKLVLGSNVGTLSLALRNAGYARVHDAGRIGLENLPNSQERENTVAPQPEPDRGVVVTVTRGTAERKQYELTDAGRREISKTTRVETTDEGSTAGTAQVQLQTPTRIVVPATE